MPSDSDAMEMRPPSNTFMACLKPSPTSPKRFASGTTQASKIISAVSEARIPSLFSFLPPQKPAAPLSTTNVVALFFVRGSPVRQTTTAILPLRPWVIQFLVPLIIQLSPSFVAVHFMLPASLPVLGSVNPQAPIHSAVASLGNHRCFCSLLPKLRIWPVQSELCAATLRPMEPSTL